MNKIYTRARAKINLTLEVLDKRIDNYHNIKSIFQRIDLYDDLMIEKTKDECFELQTNVACINNQDNIIYKAYLMLKERFQEIKGIRVVLEKRIPMQAGLGGGSADCAAFLQAMNKLFSLQMSQKTMEEIGKTLGADVVPCLYNGAIIAEGIGEIITPISSAKEYDLVLIKPELSCNTKEMYERIDAMDASAKHYSFEEIVKALKDGDLAGISKNLYNDFEEAIPDRTVIKDITNAFLENGAKGSLMTGSGSCVFGLFETKELAKRAYERLKQKYETYICAFYNANQEEAF